MLAALIHKFIILKKHKVVNEIGFLKHTIIFVCISRNNNSGSSKHSDKHNNNRTAAKTTLVATVSTEATEALAKKAEAATAIPTTANKTTIA